ncbi:winged helix-turn-helix domain-containing protein [Catellatospora sp. KI3]|uniref:winged helix-turn-helix domain-containing protein n=1 Tax=Catellatospora sp. KI3 TaxID=3041620 RepID=UPI0024825660|nr:winged helix-turn-helix domain-containing protein [Catellatospora sp. KI3]MDI1460582.1 winged helix-turn-helix domain-containing protein [Catellatospora sp. KI3]
MAVRERLVRRLDSCGAVLICADLDELRGILFPEPAAAEQASPVAAVTAVHAERVQLGGLVIEAGGHRVSWHGAPLSLTRLERRLLGCLAGPPPTVWTYQRLFQAVWGGAYLGDTSILHSAVKRLRVKLAVADGELALETVRGVGYRLVATDATRAR